MRKRVEQKVLKRILRADKYVKKGTPPPAVTNLHHTEILSRPRLRDEQPENKMQSIVERV